MAIPVYVQAVTTYPGRTQWSDTADYVVGDRVYYADSTSDYSVYVCIQNHSISGGGTPQQPDLTPNYWQAAGSKEYPFLTGPNGNIYPSGFNTTEFCVRTTNGFNEKWDPARYLSISDGSERAHVILMDGLFDSGDTGQAYMDLSNTDLYAENFQKSWFIFRYYENQSTTENCPTFNNLKIGLHNNNVSFDSHVILNDCLVSDSSPYSTRTSLRPTHRFQYTKFIQAKNCLFDFSMCSNNNLIYTPPVSAKHGQSFLKNSTFIFGKQEPQYGGIFYQAPNLVVDKCIFYIKGLVDLTTPKLTPSSIGSFTNSCVFGESFVDVDYFVAGNPSAEDDTNLLNVDPLFIDIENSDYRLRPSSPLIGGVSVIDSQQYQLESQYPQGKWFDSNAVAGGDGSWETPYNNYAEAINSFTGDEAVVLIKKGQHELRRGYWNGSNWYFNRDLPKSYPDGIKFIGMGSDTIFTTDSDVTGYGAFFVSSNDSRENLEDTPFTFKNFDILLNNTATLGRGAICTLKAEYINVNVSQAFNLGATTSNLFDYMMSSDVARGHYLKMSNCTINVSQSNNTSSTNFLVGGDGGMKQFKSCTFVDLNRTTSTNAAAPISFMHHNFGAFQGSYLQDCIIYSKTSNTQHFGTSPQSGGYQGSSSLEFKNVIVYSTNQTVSVGSNFGDNVSTADPKFIATEPHDFDLRLRPDSPGIGGIKTELSNVYYLQPGNAYNGDGSQKDASSMTADGDPGPFNEFKEIVAAGVPYGSTIVILNGTYDWTQSFGRNPSSNVGPNTWHAYTLAGYNYVAETMHEVIFDAKLNVSNVFIYKPYGGTPGSGVFLDLDTTFNGIQFNNMLGSDPNTRNMIGSVSGSAGLGSCTFKNCKFLGHINKGGAYQYPWTGGGRDTYSSTMHWDSCEISIAFDGNGGLLCGGDGFANDIYHGAWSWKNCTFYIPTGLTTFNGRNAANGTYASPFIIFGNNYSQTQRVFENNIIQIENGTASIGAQSSDKLPTIENNCFNGVSPTYYTADHSAVIESKNNLLGFEPLFVDPSNNNFSLRPLSPLIGKG